MSLLDDFEELCNAQDISIFRETLDEVLKPILISLEERHFELNLKLDNLNTQIMNLRGDMESRIFNVETKINAEMTDAYETHNTKLHNIWRDVLKIQDEVESIKFNLKK